MDYSLPVPAPFTETSKRHCEYCHREVFLGLASEANWDAHRNSSACQINKKKSEGGPNLISSFFSKAKNTTFGVNAVSQAVSLRVPSTSLSIPLSSIASISQPRPLQTIHENSAAFPDEVEGSGSDLDCIELLSSPPTSLKSVSPSSSLFRRLQEPSQAISHALIIRSSVLSAHV